MVLRAYHRAYWAVAALTGLAALGIVALFMSHHTKIDDEFGEAHVPNCYTKKIQEGDRSVVTEQKAQAELTVMQRHLVAVKHKMDLIDIVLAKRSRGETMSDAERREVSSATGSVSCDQGDDGFPE